MTKKSNQWGAMCNKRGTINKNNYKIRKYWFHRTITDLISVKSTTNNDRCKG